MKTRFWIKSITVCGYDIDDDSTVEFSQGLNVIYGPSNTGKSWVLNCIDYMFGAETKDLKIQQNMSYRAIRMNIGTVGGNITLERSIRENTDTISVASTDSNILSGNYSVRSKKGTLSLSSMWLRIIGFENPDNLKIISTKNYKVQRFTWRSFWHAFYASENDISMISSILLPAQVVAKTSAETALSTLVTGVDFSQYIEYETPQERRQRTKVIIDYLALRPQQYRERIDDIERLLNKRTSTDIQVSLDSLLRELNETDKAMKMLMAQGKEVVSKIQNIREKFVESNVLIARYNELASAYQARIERFDFVVDGQMKLSQFPEALLCPICDQPVPDELRSRLFEPHQEERKDIQIRLLDLQQAIAELCEERDQQKKEEAQLSAEYTVISNRIDTDLKPHFSKLKNDIAEYHSLLSLVIEKEQVNKMLDETIENLEALKKQKYEVAEFDISNYLPKNFVKDFGQKLLDILGACAFPSLDKVRFDERTFDAIVNDKAKSQEGKGYRSLINTAMLLTLREYIWSHETAFNPSILMIDTPLLGFDDPQFKEDSKKYIDAIPNALYEYLIMNQEFGQIIIADNEKFMPDISVLQSKCNLIHFSKGHDLENRYGFLKRTIE